MKKFSFPIRLKVLLTISAILMLVVGVITSTMANLFHQDKTAYIRDYSAAVTEDIRTGVHTILGGYVSATHVLTEMLFADYVDRDSKQKLIKPLFAAYPALLAVVSINPDDQPVSIYNAVALESAGLDSDTVLQFVSLISQHEAGTTEVQNARVEPDRGVVTLTIDYALSDTGQRQTVVAVLSPTFFRQILQRAGAFDAVLLDSNDEVVVATDDISGDVHWARRALASFGDFQGSSVIEYTDGDEQYIAGAGPIATGDLTVLTRVSATTAYLTARTLLGNLVTVGLVIIVLASIGGIVVSRRITRPLEQLSAAVHRIAKGQFNVRVVTDSRDEIGQLSRSFNEMADELNERERSLEKTQLALVQSEKMAAVGTLSAGLAHEVKNPLSAVLGYAQLAKRKLTKPDILKGHLDTIENETRRCNDIIGNLMQFSRQEKGEFDEISVNDVVSKTIRIVDHQLSLNNIRIQTNLADNIPLVLGNANQLQQVLMNLAINAEHAMGADGGTLGITTLADDTSVRITVDDTGPGIDDDVAAKIFEPFYTTKPAGQGTGLGLSVTYGIIQNHNGEISVHNIDKGGARFIIRLPLNTDRKTEAENKIVMEQVS